MNLYRLFRGLSRSGLASSLLIVSLSIASESSFAQTAAPPPPACAAAVHRQFDFWVGTWDVLNPAGQFVGTNRIERMGQCVLQENWAAARGGYVGRSLNSVGADGKWRQTWTDTSGLRLELVGGLVGGNMVLEGETPAAGGGTTPSLNRITWSPEANGVVRQLWETSNDSGKTWGTAFDGRYHPVGVTDSPAAGFFQRVAGDWIGSGTVAKREAHVELSIRRGVGSTVQLHWKNVMQGPTRSLFEGFAVYERGSDAAGYRATWWDSQGTRHTVVATVSADGSELAALWGDNGKTTYRMRDARTIEVVDSVKRPDSTWSEFGRTTLKRQ